MENYLSGVKSFLEFDPLIENVIVISEDKAACQEFLLMLQKELPKLRVVQNVGDVQQGTGSGSKLEAYVEGSGNANVVASALTSMHLHLRARYFVITSKSTWTSTIPGQCCCLFSYLGHIVFLWRIPTLLFSSIIFTTYLLLVFLAILLPTKFSLVFMDWLLRFL